VSTRSLPQLTYLGTQELALPSFFLYGMFDRFILPILDQ
jgi:hypothetical protein